MDGYEPDDYDICQDHNNRIKVNYNLMNLMIKNMITGSPLKGGRLLHVWQKPDKYPPPAKTPSTPTIMIIFILLFVVNLVFLCHNDDVVYNHLGVDHTMNL